MSDDNIAVSAADAKHEMMTTAPVDYSDGKVYANPAGKRTEAEDSC